MNGIEILLDTNIAIGILKGDPSVTSLLTEERVDWDNCAISQITRMELLSYPNLEEEEEQLIRNFLANLLVLNLNDRIEAEAIAFRRTYSAKLPDAIIAATAKVYGLRLMTLDRQLQAKFNADQTR